MQDIRLLNTVYEDVPAVELPKEGGGTARFDDTSDANATANDIISGKTAYVNGSKLTGTHALPTGTLSITSNDTYDVTNYASAVVNVPQGITPTGTISITSNGTVDVTNYASANVNVSGGNGYGGDGTWSRPLGMPKLDDMDISSGNVVYMTYLANEEFGFCGITIDRSSGSITFDVGHIENGSYVAESTSTYSSNTTVKKFFGSQNGTYKVLRISGLITKIALLRNNFDEIDGNYRFQSCQGIIEVYGNLPNLQTWDSGQNRRLKAVHVGNAKFTTLSSAFFNCSYLESVDSRNWDMSNCTSLQSAFDGINGILKVDVSNWNTANVTNCQRTFYQCGASVIDISNWKMASVTNTSQMMQMVRCISITVPSSLTTISANTFNINDGGQIAEYHFKATTPPSLANTNAFQGIRSNAKIYVPSASLSTYQGASNWSSYSSYMVGE